MGQAPPGVNNPAPPVGPGPGNNGAGGGGTSTAKEPPKDPPKDATQPTLLSGGQVSRNTVYQYVLKSVCWIITKLDRGGAMGSGELIDRENRLVLTNYHVVHGMRDFVVFFPLYDNNGKLIPERDVYLRRATAMDQIKGKVVAHDTKRDMALIQLDRLPDNVDSIPLTKNEPKEGDNLHSVGNPGASDALWIYTPGNVRKVYTRKWTAGGGDLVLHLEAKIIEANSATNHGDSGGPCVNDRGELVGITQGGAGSGNDTQLMSFFIEHAMLEDFITQAFEKTADLKGKTWVRSTRPPIPEGNTASLNLATYVRQLKSPDDDVRAQGVQGLNMLGPDAHQALPELIPVLGDKNPLVARLAANALRQVGQAQPEDLQYLLPALESNNPDAKSYVLEALAVLGQAPEAESARDQVLKLTTDSNTKVREKAMRAVGKMTPVVGDKKAVESLEKGLQDSDRRVRGAAASAITTSTSMKNDVAKLKDLLNRKEPEVRAPAALALGRLGEKAKGVVPDLVAVIRADEDREVRRACFLALKEVGAEPQVIVGVLRVGIQDGDVQIRRAALEAAGGLAASAKDLVPTIIEALSDEDVRQSALAALKKLGPEAASSGAVRVADLLSVDKTLRANILETLDAMWPSSGPKPSGSTAQQVVPKVIAVFADEAQEPVREKAAQCLSHIGRPAVPDLGKALSNPTATVREGAAKSLAAMPSEGRLVLVQIQAAWNAETNVKAKEALADCLKRVLAAPPPKA
jgi:HEAT repeat protein/S1-C subfamily serine protease